MKKLTLTIAMLAMVVVSTVPALAQTEQESEQDADSGDVGQSVDIENLGDNVNLCIAILQVANTGNAQSSQTLLQYEAETDDIEVEESTGEITVNPTLVIECQQTINQVATASGEPSPAPTPAPAPAPAPTPSPAPATAPSSGAKAGALKELPRTGGDGTTLLTIGVGVLLVGGGLAARRIFGRF